MFFIGVFGIDSKSIEIGNVCNFICKGCGNKVEGVVYKTYNCFHFFFIPLIKWNKQYYLKCCSCSRLYKLSNYKGEKIEKGDVYNYGINIDEDDLVEVNYNNEYYKYDNYYNIIKRCKACGKELNGDFKYCPYCGKEL